MPYEALANVLSQISGDYAHNVREQRIHDRNRSEQLADIEAQRAYDRSREDVAMGRAKEMARFNADLSIEKQLEALQRVAPAQYEATLRQAAANLGDKDAFTRPLPELIAAQEKLKDNEAVKAALRTAMAQLETARQTMPQRKSLEFEDNKLEAQSALSLYNANKARLDELRKSSPSLQGPLTVDELANEKVENLLKGLRAMSPSDAAAQIKNLIPPESMKKGKPTLKDFETALSTAAARTKFAAENSLVSDSDVKAVNIRLSQAMRGESQQAVAEVAGVVKGMNDAAEKLIRFGIDPSLKWEDQPMVKNPDFWKTATPTAPAVPPAPVSTPVPTAPSFSFFGPATPYTAPQDSGPLPRVPVDHLGSFFSNYRAPAAVAQTPAVPAAPVPAPQPVPAPTPRTYETPFWQQYQQENQAYARSPDRGVFGTLGRMAMAPIAAGRDLMFNAAQDGPAAQSGFWSR